MNWETEYWETLSPEGDKMIHENFKRFVAKELTLKELFFTIENVPNIYADAELSKETTNKVFDHLVYLGYDEDETVDLYHKVMDISNMDTTMDIIKEDIKENIEKMDFNLNDIDKIMKK